MKVLTTIILLGSILVLNSCGGKADKKDDAAATDKSAPATSAPSPDQISTSLSPATKTDSANKNFPDNNEILAKIDQYLVSTPDYKAPAAGNGLVNATILVKNKLSGVTFQKAIVEVNILAADGSPVADDFYTIQNIEPDDTETIKLPNNSKGASIKCHVVKVKSAELTNGEMILVGDHFDPASVKAQQ